MRLLGAPDRLTALATKSWRDTNDLGIETIENAFVPLLRPCAIKTFDPEDCQTFSGWKGGVYDLERRVCPSSLLERHWTRVTVPFFARELDIGNVHWRRGDAMYGGLLFHHFGRFLLETTNRLWWCLAQNFRGPIILQNTRPRLGMPDFARRFFALLGIGDRVILADRPLGYDRIFVPHVSYVGQLRFHEAFRAPFVAAGAAAERLTIATDCDYGADKAGLYLSRTRFANRSSDGESLVEDKLLNNGCHIAHTQNMPLEAQILLMRRHTTIVGIAGSAFHNILFADDPVWPVYICKDHDINANFPMIDELMANDGLYIYAGSATHGETSRTTRELLDDHWNDIVLDTEKVLRLLEEGEVL